LIRSEEKGLELMQAALPHLRLLTLPVEKLNRLGRFLTDSQKRFLANRLMFKDYDSTEKIPDGLNPSILSRSRNQKFVVDFIDTKDLVEMDSDILGQVPTETANVKFLKISIKAKRDLFVRGIELLTRTNFSPTTEKNLGTR